MSWPDHPSPFGQHPWQDPLAPQDIFNPRPDQELAIAGPLAPRPEDFPFNDAGRQDYYAAVRAAALQQQMVQHMQMNQMRAHADAQRQEVERARASKTNLLLLL